MCDSRRGRQSLIIPRCFFPGTIQPLAVLWFLTGKLWLLGFVCIWGFVSLLILATSAPSLDSAPVRSEAGGVTPITRSQNDSRHHRLRKKG